MRSANLIKKINKTIIRGEFVIRVRRVSPGSAAIMAMLLGALFLFYSAATLREILFSDKTAFTKDKNDWQRQGMAKIVEVGDNFCMVEYNVIIGTRRTEFTGSYVSQRLPVYYNPSDISEAGRGRRGSDWIVTTGYVRERFENSFVVEYEIIETKIGRLPGREARDSVGRTVLLFWYNKDDPSILARELRGTRDLVNISISVALGVGFIFFGMFIRKKLNRQAR